MELKEITDPRDPWMKARRLELVRYAHKNGHVDISERWPADLIRQELKKRGLPPPNVPNRRLPTVESYNPRSGDTAPEGVDYGEWKDFKAQFLVETVDPLEAMRRDFEREMQAPEKEPGYNDMRKELKSAGVKLDRKWTKEQVKAEWEKLIVNNTSDGR
jgi:hypothetical protein